MMNSYYLASPGNKQNLLGCDAPLVQSITLPGFMQAHNYYITYFPTRIGAPVPPNDTVVSNANGEVTLDLSSMPLGGIANNYMDTLHADYAFVISPYPVPRRMLFVDEEAPTTVAAGWDFTLHPNPAADAFFLTFPDEAPKDIEVYDLAGRRLYYWGSVTSSFVPLSAGGLTPGAYYVHVFTGAASRMKRLIIHR